MTLANPFALLWGLLAIPLVILYMRAVRVRREPVATGMIWREVFAAERVRTTWRRWRGWVSLAVQLTVLLLLVVALAEPQIPGPRRLVLIVDNSASMSATDVEPKRLDVAKRAAERILAAVRPRDFAAVLSAADVAVVRCGWTGDRRTLEEAIRSIPATRATTRVDAAVALARRMLGDGFSGEIVLVSDCCFDSAADLAAAGDVDLFRVGKGAGNVAVTRLAARSCIADPQRRQVFVEVRNFSDRPAERTVTLETASGETIESLLVELARDGRGQKVFQVGLPDATGIAVRLDPHDACKEDDRLSLTISADRSKNDAVEPVDFATNAGLPPTDLPNRNEGDLRAVAGVGTDATSVDAATARPSPWLYPAGLSVLLLTLQWGFYQRRWLS